MVSPLSFFFRKPTQGLSPTRERYLCVEPGYVSGFKTIQPGESWIGGQVLTPIASPGTSSL